MVRLSTRHEWYRYLDVSSDEEAAAAISRMAARLDELHDELHTTSRPIGFAPDGDIAEALRVAGLALSEAIEMLQQTASRFRADQSQSA